MILILALWAMVVGYTLVFLGLDKLSSSPKNYSFGQVFFPQFLGAQITKSDAGGGGAAWNLGQPMPQTPNPTPGLSGNFAGNAFQKALGLFQRPSP